MAMSILYLDMGNWKQIGDLISLIQSTVLIVRHSSFSLSCKNKPLAIIFIKIFYQTSDRYPQ